MTKYSSDLKIIKLYFHRAILAGFLLSAACTNDKKNAGSIDTIPITPDSTIVIDSSKARSEPALPPSGSEYIDTGDTTPDELLTFAKSLIGIPYRYGSTDPDSGFDCSGFITYVFNHFNIRVPRSSIDFTNVNRQVDVSDAKKGDLILFTGTDSLERNVGHMGIITDNNNGISFIHSTSGKAYGVTITPFNEYYQGRFVKVVRVFPQNE